MTGSSDRDIGDSQLHVSLDPASPYRPVQISIRTTTRRLMAG